MKIINEIKSFGGLKFSFFLLAFCLLGASFNSVKAASVIADTPCDDLYYETLSSRAWLEAQREITQNQNLILKPDSVFEYTCFDLLLNELADHASSLLSETTSFGPGLGANSMDDALQNLIGTSLITYIGNNYGSLPVGGGYNLLGGHPAGAGISHAPRPIVGALRPYTCDIMARVWQAAKCINFASNEDTDGFYPFEEYATNPIDKRYLPTLCLPATAAWASNLATALTSGPWTNDPVQTYYALTNAQSCSGSTCACTGDPVPTGVQVVRSGYDVNTYEEHVCLQPGCRYHPGGQLNAGGPSATAGCYGR